MAGQVGSSPEVLPKLPALDNDQDRGRTMRGVLAAAAHSEEGITDFLPISGSTRGAPRRSYCAPNIQDPGGWAARHGLVNARKEGHHGMKQRAQQLGAGNGASVDTSCGNSLQSNVWFPPSERPAAE